MLKKEDRLGEKFFKSKAGRYIQYLHKCLNCSKNMWKTASMEKVSTGYCISCVARNHKFKLVINSKNERQCPSCQMLLPISEFIKSKRHNIHGSSCLSCGNLKKFNITNSDYHALLNNQDKKCAICGKEETKTQKGKTIKLSVDHCHSTGKIRGLLCGRCNSAIGLFNDNQESLRKAILYLEK